MRNTLAVMARRARYSAELLLEKRLWLFLLVDSILVFRGLLESMIAGGRTHEIYVQSVLFPSLLLGLPALSGVLALERRAGSLDLALAVPSTERYFRRRLVPILVFLTFQGWVLVTVAHLETGESSFEWLRYLYQAVELHAFLGAVVLFWATRLESSGAVFLAATGTSGLAYGWLSRRLDFRFFDWDAGTSRQQLIEWFVEAVFLLFATLLFYLYARERLRRPETLAS